MPPRVVIPFLTGFGIVFFLPFVRDRTRVFGMTLIHKLGTKQPQLGRSVANLMINAHLPNLRPLLWHINDEAVDQSACSTGLIVDGLDGGSNDLEVVVRFQGFVHLSLVPQLLEQSRDDSEVGRGLWEHFVGRAVSNGNGEESVCTHDRTSCHGFRPCSILDRLGQVQRRKNPGRLLENSDPVLPYLELLRHFEATEDSLLVNNQNGGQGVHPGEHLIGLTDLDDLVPLRQGIGLVFEGWPRDWIYHRVDCDWALVLDHCHVVDFHRLLPGWWAIAGV